MSAKVIYKYGPIRHDSPTEIKGRVVHIDWFDGIRVWCELNESQENEISYVEVFGTGERYPEEFIHLGTAIDPDLRFVWHVVKV